MHFGLRKSPKGTAHQLNLTEMHPRDCVPLKSKALSARFGMGTGLKRVVIALKQSWAVSLTLLNSNHLGNVPTDSVRVFDLREPEAPSNM